MYVYVIDCLSEERLKSYSKFFNSIRNSTFAVSDLHKIRCLNKKDTIYQLFCLDCHEYTFIDDGYGDLVCSRCNDCGALEEEKLICPRWKYVLHI